MKPSILAIVALLLASPAIAQQADLAVDLFVNDPLGAAGPNPIFADIENRGPETAANVAVIVALARGTIAGQMDPRCSSVTAELIRCEIGAFAASAKERIAINSSAPAHPGPATFAAEITSDTNDPNRANNFDSQAAQVTVSADLRIVHFDAAPALVRPGELTTWRIDVDNRGFSQALDAVLSLQLPAGWEVAAIDEQGWDCSFSGASVTCTRSIIDLFGAVPLRVQARAPASPAGGVVTASASISSATPDPDPSLNAATASATVYRILLVTTTADDGSGSLRDALESAADVCAFEHPCRVEFDIAAAASAGGWLTIQPLSPLPPVTTAVTIDGSTQSDTNPLGPDIELNGSLAGDADGLILAGWDAAVTGLTVNGFERNGILVVPSGSFRLRSIEGNYIGTDATGLQAVPNGLRGVGVYNRETGNLDIVGNVISGNRYSGIWCEGFDVLIDGNRIGVGADGVTQLPNGASGIYFGPTSSSSGVTANIVAHNVHWGIVLDPQSRSISIRGNSIHSNFAPGIDYGHDFVTPNDPSDSIVDFPVLTSAVYDRATDSTRIRGTHTGADLRPGEGSYVFDFYANDVIDSSGHGEGRQYLGELRTIAAGAFEFVFNGNLRGLFVTATRTDTESFGFKVAPAFRDATFQETSEFSAAIGVVDGAP